MYICIMSEDTKEKTLFELLFAYHIQQMELYNGKEKCQEYVNEASAAFRGILNLLLVSALLCVGPLTGFSFISSESFLCLLLLVGYVIYLVFSSFRGLEKIRALAFGDVPLVMKWIEAVTVVAIVSLLSSGYFLYHAYYILKLNFSDGETIELKEVGMDVRIPVNFDGPQWGDPRWNKKPSPEDVRPEYVFSVSNEYQTMFFNISADYMHRNVSMAECKDSFDEMARFALDSLVTFGPEIILSGDREVHKTIGYRRDSPKHTYVYYRMVHEGAVISYAYRFQTAKCDAEKEFRFADEMLGNITFYDPVISEAAQRKREERREPVVDKRPADYTVDGHGVEISSAGVRIFFPEGAGPLNWNACTRREYDFDMKVGRSDVNFNLLVVWTSETAPLTEFEGEFSYWADKILDKRIIEEPSLEVFGAESAYNAV